MADGVFIKSWEVHCAGCEAPLLGIGRHGSTPDAAEDARAEGWRIRGGLWHCEPCVSKKDRQRAALKSTAAQEGGSK
jgi:hypothetical protein